MTNKNLAMCVLFHGEAVRFNRGKSRLEDFNFKYLRGQDGGVFPYVSSQSFKKLWRETLLTPASPITRPTKADGTTKNQVYTAADPINFVDDDLFGYMRAGASATENTASGDEDTGEGDEEESIDLYLLRTDNLKGEGRDLLRLLRDTNDKAKHYNASQIIKAQDNKAWTQFGDLDEKTALTEEQQQTLVDIFNLSVQNEELNKEEGFQEIPKADLGRYNKAVKGAAGVKVIAANRTLLGTLFAAALNQPKPDPTTRRTAPIRMHALVAFSGIKTAKDFQTFSRDTASTGNYSVINPNPVGFYSAWLKTRILIEGHRIGSFDIVPNGDLAPKEEDKDNKRGGNDIKMKTNLYVRKEEQVKYVELPSAERNSRFRAAITSLADINNDKGPSSGALHDGSLRPKAFIAAMMRCADSPFDDVWVGTNDRPRLSLGRLRAALEDYKDLFLEPRRVYVGLPLDWDDDEGRNNEDAFIKAVEDKIRVAGFEPVVGSPRQTLLKMAGELVLHDETVLDEASAA